MIRFVVDASTLVSGCTSPHGDSPTSLLHAELATGRFELIVCPRLLDEVSRALRKPYFHGRVSELEIDEIVGGIREAASVCPDPIEVDAVLPDPTDDFLLALARETSADAIVTSDKDLLDHDGLQPPAISARDACKRIGLS